MKDQLREAKIEEILSHLTLREKNRSDVASEWGRTGA